MRADPECISPSISACVDCSTLSLPMATRLSRGDGIFTDDPALDDDE
jgi:hypothetical protein